MIMIYPYWDFSKPGCEHTYNRRLAHMSIDYLRFESAKKSPETTQTDQIEKRSDLLLDPNRNEAYICSPGTITRLIVVATDQTYVETCSTQTCKMLQQEAACGRTECGNVNYASLLAVFFVNDRTFTIIESLFHFVNYHIGEFRRVFALHQKTRGVIHNPA